MVAPSFWYLIKVTSVVLSTTLLATVAAQASELPDLAEPSVSTDATLLAPEPLEVNVQTGSELIGGASSPSVSTAIAPQPLSAQPLFTNTDRFDGTEAAASTSALQVWTDPPDTDQTATALPEGQIRMQDGDQPRATQQNKAEPVFNPEPIAASAPVIQESIQIIDSDAHWLEWNPSDFAGTAAGNLLEPTLLAFNPTPLALKQLPPDEWQISQAEPDSSTSPDQATPDQATPDEKAPDEKAPEATPDQGTPDQAKPPAHSPRWRFTFQPYAFVPVSIEGSTTVRDYTADFDLGLGDVLPALNFAFAGRFEAWRGNLGFIVDTTYLSVEQDRSTSPSVPNCLCDIFPSQIDTTAKVKFGQFDLGVAYRFGTTNPDAATEFELGPLLFDVIVGMRIYAIHQEIDISTNLGTSRTLERDNTIVEPLLSGLLRRNLSPKLAFWFRGDVAGFGFEGLTLSWAVTGGFDWMFSGNTSLVFAYRFSSIKYTADVRGEDLELNLALNGPYLGVVFRF